MRVDFKNSPDILNNYYKYMIEINNYSKGTAENYYSSILYFFIFIKEHKGIIVPVKDFEIFIVLGVEEADIIDFMIFLNCYRENNAKTRKNRLFAIKSFYKYIFTVYKPYCTNKINPSKDIDSPLITKRLPKYLNLEQAKQLCNVFNENNCKEYIRNNLIIYLFLNLGLRKAELVNLNINSINFNTNEIKVRGKGNKERRIYISEAIKSHILNYLELRNNIDLYSSKPLFVIKDNTRISISTIRYIVDKAYALAGLDKMQFNVHSLRHTAATLMYNATNGDILAIKEILGHSSIESTQIYTHIKNNMVKNAINSNPLANYGIEEEM